METISMATWIQIIELGGLVFAVVLFGFKVKSAVETISERMTQMSKDVHSDFDFVKEKLSRNAERMVAIDKDMERVISRLYHNP